MNPSPRYCILVFIQLCVCVNVAFPRLSRRCEVLPAEGCTCRNRVRPQLTCNNLLLTELPRFHSNMSDTYVLKLSHNDIRTLEDKPFVDLVRLRRLFLNNNSINIISEDAFEGIEVHLKFLDLSHNKIYDIPTALRNLPRVVILNLASNEIAAIFSGIFSKMTQLKTLLLDGNNILTIHNNAFWGMGNLRKLSISMALGLCDLAHIPTHETPNLEELVVGNSIAGGTSAPFFQGLYNLKKLSFINCMITDTLYELDRPSILAFMNTLESLSLDDNFLTLDTSTQRKIQQLSGLRHLSLNKNWIESVDETMLPFFQSLAGLQELHLKDNRISVVDGTALEPLLNLKVLDLRHNRLTTLDIDTSLPLFTSGITLSLSSNPWRCDCGLYWLKLMLRQQSYNCKHVSQAEVNTTLSCAQPDPLSGILIKDLPNWKCHKGRPRSFQSHQPNG